MRNIKLTLEYRGTNFSGWQIQGSAKSQGRRVSPPTIQGTIEKVLRKILQEEVRLIASGRTDAGVHAEAQVANFKTKAKINSVRLQLALNGLLRPDIVVKKVQEVPLDFHARYQAKSKLYRYTILNRRYPSAHLRDYVYFYKYPLDIRRMKEGARLLRGKKDFKAFQASDKKSRGSIRTIKKIGVRRKGDLVYIEVEADGFLYNMVRNIAGTLIAMGRGSDFDLKKLLGSKDRRLTGPTAPACGLCLIKVKY